MEERADRTQPASTRRRAEARRQGRVPHSGDLSAALMLGSVALLLAWQGPALVMACGDWLRVSLAHPPVLTGEQLVDRSQSSVALWGLSLKPLIGTVTSMLACLWGTSVLVRLIQTGPVWAPDLASPRWERVSLASGMRRLFSSESFVRGLFWSSRLMLVGLLVMWTLHGEASAIDGLSASAPRQMAVSLGDIVSTFALRLCGGLMLLAVGDFGWQWWRHEQSLRMTVEEQRAERRESEGAGGHDRSPLTRRAGVQ